MDRPRTLIPRLPLEEDRIWRLVLAAIFLIGVICRFVPSIELSTHPVGQLEQWAGTEPWHYRITAEDAVVQRNRLLRGPNLLLTREHAELATLAEWEYWAANRLPRGTPAVYLAAASYLLTQSLAVYAIVSIFAGAFVGVLVAAAGARLFRDRRAGAVAGILAAMQGTLALSSLYPGPWMWEALLLAALVWSLLRVRDNPTEPGEWLLYGLIAGAAIWFRPFFWWSVLLLPLAVLAWRLRPDARMALAVLVPVILSAGVLTARNVRTETGAAPVVGYAAWDFLETTHPGAILRTQVPTDPMIVFAGEGKLLPTVRLALSLSEYRQALPRNAGRKLREFFGGRDETHTVNVDYLRLRSESLRWLTLASDVTMAAGWGAMLFLLWRRRFPPVMAVLLALLLVHGLLFRTSGMDRAMLHVVMCLAMAGALAHAMETTVRRTALPFVFLIFWAGMAWILAVDDQARGTRYRFNEFAYAAREFERRGEDRLARAEVRDYQRVRRRQHLLEEFWNVTP